MVIAYRMPSNILHMYWPHIIYVLAFSYKRGRDISKSQFRDTTLASGIDEIKTGPEKFGKKNKRGALYAQVLCSK